MINYFETMGLEVKYEIDLAQLEERFLSLQYELHPDKQLHKSHLERTSDLAQVLDVNVAYNVLKSDVKRAEHLLQLSGIDLEDVTLSSDALMEAFQDREQLAALESQDDIEQMVNQVRASIEQHKREFNRFYSKQDLISAARSQIGLKYKHKLLDEIYAR